MGKYDYYDPDLDYKFEFLIPGNSSWKRAVILTIVNVVVCIINLVVLLLNIFGIV